MPNALYRKLPTNEYMRQDGGGPAYFEVRLNSQDGQWYPQFTYDGQKWFLFQGFTTQAAAQTALDNYISAMNAGTA